jgi:hypothetical protein
MSSQSFISSQSYETTDLSSVRGIKEILIKTFAIHFTAVAAVGHLMSLRNLPHKHSAALLFYIIGFFLFPVLPVAQLLRQLRSTIVLGFNRRRRGLTYYLSTCCGMYAAKSDPEQTIETIPLIKVDADRIGRKRGLYNALWLGCCLH